MIGKKIKKKEIFWAIQKKILFNFSGALQLLSVNRISKFSMSSVFRRKKIMYIYNDRFPHIALFKFLKDI